MCVKFFIKKDKIYIYFDKFYVSNNEDILFNFFYNMMFSKNISRAKKCF